MSTTPIFDVIIVGAGISGINAAYRLQTETPQKSFIILEGRGNMGGTWDLFKYPGIRSDSDMYTFGFEFHPWNRPEPIAKGEDILEYIKDTAQTYGIDKKIQYHHHIESAHWDSGSQLWTLHIREHEVVNSTEYRCKFLFTCSGYYDYEKGYLPEFKGYKDFEGTIIHPQHWPENVNYSNKEIIIIGSGATAVTLAPSLAEKAKKVTLLQRTPTYIGALPRIDKFAQKVQQTLPEQAAYQVIRWQKIVERIVFYGLSKQYPEKISKLMTDHVASILGDKYNDKDFKPPYNPWDQRVCADPGAVMLKDIKNGKVEVVTDHIDTFTKNGILLKSGKELKADIIVTATGLNLKLLGGIELFVDDKKVVSSDLYAYRGVMMSGIPNFAFILGYTNASWTLKSDISAQFITKLLKFMDKKNYAVCIPNIAPEDQTAEPLIDFNSGYVLRALDMLPKQGKKHPWKMYQNYVRDLVSMKYEALDDRHLIFQK